MAGSYRLVIEEGSELRRVLTWKQGETLETATPKDLTGYTAFLQVRRHKRSSKVALAASTTDGRISLGGAAGTITIVVPASATRNLDLAEENVYDLEMVPPAGAEATRRTLQGPAVYDREVTRS